jgi:di/tricarboxylate transporter
MEITYPAIFTLILTLVAAVLLISELLRPDLIALIVMVILGLAGIVSPQDTFSGFSGSAVMTLLGISIISEGLHQTGVTHWLGNLMFKLGGRSEATLVLTTMLVSAGLSLFMNNIAAVGVLLPAVMTLSRQTRVPPSRLMMPLAYGTVLGGMATLLTTSNIIVSGTLRDAGIKPFGLLDFFPIGAPLVLIGVIYMLSLGRRLLPKENPTSPTEPSQLLRMKLANLYQIQKSLFEIEVLPESPMVDLSILNGRWSNQLGVNVIGITHNSHTYLAPSNDRIIYAGDRLLVQGDVDLERLPRLGLRLAMHSEGTPDIASATTVLAEVVVSPHAGIIGSTLRQLGFRDRYNLNVLGIWRGNKPILTRLADLPLRFGDALLVQGPVERIHVLEQESDLVVLQEDPDAVLKPGKHRRALLITLLTLGVAATGFLPVAIVVMVGAVLMVLSNCISMNDAYHGIEWKAIFLIAGMWPLSIAIRSTGLADLTVHSLINLVGQVPPLAIAALLLSLALVLTQLMSGQVACLVLAPLALAAASLVKVDPRGMAMAVALGCSLAFPTPFGHPVNIMVMSPGGYSFRDYLRVGLPLTVLVMAGILVGLKLFWNV